MSAPRKKKAPGKPGPRASGPTQPESKRKNPQLLLRLPPYLADELRAKAAKNGVSVSGLVALCVAIAMRSDALSAALEVARAAK